VWTRRIILGTKSGGAVPGGLAV